MGLLSNNPKIKSPEELKKERERLRKKAKKLEAEREKMSKKTGGKSRSFSEKLGRTLKKIGSKGKNQALSVLVGPRADDKDSEGFVLGEGADDVYKDYMEFAIGSSQKSEGEGGEPFSFDEIVGGNGGEGDEGEEGEWFENGLV